LAVPGFSAGGRKKTKTRAAFYGPEGAGKRALDWKWRKH